MAHNNRPRKSQVKSALQEVADREFDCPGTIIDRSDCRRLYGIITQEIYSIIQVEETKNEVIGRNETDGPVPMIGPSIINHQERERSVWIYKQLLVLGQVRLVGKLSLEKQIRIRQQKNSKIYHQCQEQLSEIVQGKL